MTINPSHVLIEKVVLNTATPSVTFSNINQGYTDLLIKISTRTDRASIINDFVNISFNGVTTGFSGLFVQGTGSGTASYTYSSASAPRYVSDTSASSATTGTFGSAEIYIPNYSVNGIIKSYTVDGVAENNAAGGILVINSGYTTSTTNITSITFGVGVGTNFIPGSTFSVYGIANSLTTPTKAPKATGGDIIQTDGTYWYHAFINSGSFTPQTPLTCDALVVAGGGASGGYFSGGGGAGGLLGISSTNLLANVSQTVLIGAGGSVATGNISSNGSNSLFGSNTAIGGGTGGTGGGGTGTYPSSGGSGGGAGNTSGYTTPGTGTANQGYSGGSATTSTSNAGGGGAGQAGVAGTPTVSGNGGNGATYNTLVGGTAGPYAFIDAMGAATGCGQLSGGHYYFAGGGGGCGCTGSGGNATSGTGGLGGGGNGGLTNSGSGATITNSTPGTANTGGGGGGGNNGTVNTYGATGGSGVVIVRYLA